MKGYDEGRIVFDKYLDQSLKNKTRLIRSKSSAEYAVHPDMSLTMSIKDLLSASSTKRRLTVMLAEATLDHFIKQQQSSRFGSLLSMMIRLERVSLPTR